MEVGDSFFVPDPAHTGVKSIATMAAKSTGHKYTTRVEGGGLRVWRVA
jgi:hypothetical protein